VQGEIAVRWPKSVFCVGVLLAFASPAFPQVQVTPVISPNELLKVGESPLIGEVQFSGLRRIAPEAVSAQIALRVGDRFDPEKIDRDVRTLARLSWFESIQVERTNFPSTVLPSPDNQKRIALVFHLAERASLTMVNYSGSRLLSRQQIEKMLEEKKLAPGLGKPADPVQLQRVAVTIQSSLYQLGHPEARVQIQREELPNATVSIRFEINDGPYLPVRQVRFAGDPELSRKLLRAQMQSIAPGKPFSSLRGKDAYTPEAFEADRRQLLEYFQNHGYPEARIGNPQVSRIIEPSRRWFPWPHRVTRTGLSLSIPVQAGLFYRFESVLPSLALEQAANHADAKSLTVMDEAAAKAYSAGDVEKFDRWWQARLQPDNSESISSPFPAVEARQTFDAENHTVRVVLDLSDTPPYIVERIEFLGLHRFCDRYVRRRMALREGQPVNDRALEAGLARLARTGYFRQIRKEDIQIHLDEAKRTARITIRLEEIGRQRSSLVGGSGQFGNTVGMVYSVFDLLQREELLSAQLEGGPESFEVMLGLAKEGIFGTRGSLAFSVFNNVVRPRFAKSAQGPFFASHAEGITIPWTYALTNTDSLGVNYTLSRTTSDNSLGILSGTNVTPLLVTKTNTSSRSLGVGWLHDTTDERILISNSASGGFLGGTENMIRSSGQYSRILRDPVLAPGNSWAFRTTFSGAGSYRGDMPFYSRFFFADEIVRGLRPGELGPDGRSARIAPSGATTYSPTPAGANLVTAANAEYRVPLVPGAQAAAFFDAGAGWLLPNWLGPAKPTLLSSSNGVLHGSTGIEIRWQVPGIQVPVRVYYAVNVMRLDRAIHLSDKSTFFARNRFSAFGWGLGALF
jgi:outer membrane protein assembly complex protein YaeT